MQEPQVHRLANGFTVAIDVMPEARSAAVTLQTRAGSRYDPEEAQGLAHFAEHMLFKGAGSLGADEQAERIEDVGGDINAWTGLDHMAIDLRSLAEHVPMSIGIISAMVRDPWLKDEDVETEKPVVLSEMDGLDDDDLLIEIAHEVGYVDQPYARRTIGTSEHVASLDAPRIRSWLADRFRATDMVLSVAGGVDPEAVLRAAQDAFGDMPLREAGRIDPRPTFHAGRATERSRMGQGKLALLWDAPVPGDEGYHAWPLALAILGGSPSSRLFRRIRQELGLCYDVQAWAHASVDVGQAVVDVTTETGKVRQAYREVMASIERMADEVTEAELVRAKMRRRSSMLMLQDNVNKRSERHATLLLDRGRSTPISETIARMDLIDLDQIRNVARTLAQAPKVVANVGGGATATA